MKVVGYFSYLTIQSDGTSAELIICTVTSKPFAPQPVVMLRRVDYDYLDI